MRARFGVVAVVVSVALLASGLTAVAVTRPDRKAGGPALPSLAAEPFAVTLSAALQRGSTLVGQPVLLGSQAVGLNRKVVALELWDGGRLVERTATGTRPSATFRWVPLNTGPHLLHARGISQDGKTARSAPVPVDVLALRVKAPPALLPTVAGETGSALAARLGVAPRRLSLLVRNRVVAIGAGGRVPAGAVAQVAVTRSAQPAPSDAVVPEPAPVGGGTPLGATQAPPVFVPGTLTPARAAPLPLPVLDGPSVTATSDGCRLTLKVTGTGGRKATVESAAAGAPGFVRGLARTGDGALVVKDLSPGVHVWDVRTSEGVSSPISASVPESCAPGNGWTGNASLVNGILTIPEPMKDVYVYLGVDDKPFVRIPQSHEQYLSAPTRRLDVSALLPALDGKRLVMEVWRKVDTTSSTQFGTGVLNASGGRSLQDVVGEPTAVDLQVVSTKGLAHAAVLEGDQTKVDFLWKASSPRVTGVFWQVLAAPLTPANTDLSPYSLVKGGFSMSKGSGTFSIDTSTLPVLKEKPALATLGPPDLKGVKATLASTSPVPATITSDPLTPAVVGRFWVRVLPLVHTEGQLFEGPMGIASSAVPVDLPVPVAKPVTFTVTSLALTAGAVPNPGLRSCLRVTKVPWPNGQPTSLAYYYPSTPAEQAAADAERTKYGLEGAVAHAFYPSPGTYCPTDFPPEECDDVFCYLEDAVGAFIDFVGTVWDYVAAAYNGIIKLAVDIIAKFNPICAALTISGASAAGTCEQIGALAASVAISAVLAAYGLPPSLPTSEDLVSIAQGDLSVLAVELLKQFGVPCDDLKLDETQSAALIASGNAAGVSVPNAGGKVDACLYTANLLLDQVREQTKKAIEKDVVTSTGLPYFDVPGLEFVPEPKGHLSPTVLTVVAVPDRPLTFFEALTVSACQLGSDVTTQSGLPAPFKNARGRLHRIPTPDPADPLATVAASVNGLVNGTTGAPPGAWAERFVMSTPSSPNLDVDSVYEGLTLKASVTGACLSNPQQVVTSAYGKPLPR